MKKILYLFILFSLFSCHKEEMRYCWVFEMVTTTVRDPIMPPYPITINDAISRCWLTEEEADAYSRTLNSSITWYGSGYSMTEIKVCTRYFIY